MMAQSLPAPKPSTPLERFLLLPVMEQARYHPRGDYYMTCCPAHGDTEPSLLVREDDKDGHVVLVCFAGCERSAICAAVGITESDLYKNARVRKISSGPERKLTLLDLAVGKLIHPRIFSLLDMEDDYTYRTADGTIVKHVVKIPYFNEDGSQRPRSRIRTAVSAGSGSFWEGLETDKLAPYGLHKLQEARDAGLLWIVEGESDCWTNWMHSLPALGIPGASLTSLLQPSHVAGIQALYLVREPMTPGKKADAGRTFVEGLRIRLKEIGYQGGVFVVDLKESHGVKDLNDLHQKLFSQGRMRDYKDELQKAVNEATPLDLSPSGAMGKEQLSTVKPLITAALATGDPAALYHLAPRIAGLSPEDQAILMAHIAVSTNATKIAGFSKRDLNRLVKEEVAARTKQQIPLPRVINRRDVVLSGDIDEDAEQVLTALYAANTTPVLFIRGARLARCRISEEGKPFIEEIDANILLYEMSRVARFVHFHEAKQSLVPTYPPVAIARHILAKGNWQFPPLRGVTEVPVIRDDGTILEKPGYDAQTRMIYLPQPGLQLSPIPNQPTPQEIEAARDYVWQFFAQFNYESQADAANAFGAILTVVTRSLFDFCPMFLVDGVKPGCGKSLFVQSHAAVGLGRVVASSPLPQDETEWQKTLTAHLLSGNTYLSLDNVRGTLRSGQLEAFLTSPSWSARILGTMQAPELLQRTLVVANGNNIEIGGDLPRRCVRIRLTTISSQPWMQQGFTYSPLLKHVLLNRGKILSALLTLVRAWFVAGKPMAPTVPALGTFSDWSGTIGGILAHSKVPGFLENLEDMYNETDSEGPQWTAFLETWEQKFGPQRLLVSELIEALQNDKDFANLLPDTLSPSFAEESKGFGRKFGKALRDRRNMPFGPHNARLQRSEDKHKKQSLWSVTSQPNAGMKPRLWVITGTGQTDSSSDDVEKEPQENGEARDVQRTQLTLVPTQEEVLETQREERKHNETSNEDFNEASDGSNNVQNREGYDNEDQSIQGIEEEVLTCEQAACQKDLCFYDDLGNRWCEEHFSRRGQLINRGRQLAFPALAEYLAAGEEVWSTFAKVADDAHMTLALDYLTLEYRDTFQQQDFQEDVLRE